MYTLTGSRDSAVIVGIKWGRCVSGRYTHPYPALLELTTHITRLASEEVMKPELISWVWHRVTRPSVEV